MTNCVKGDLAIIVRPRVPENLGALVEVVRVWRKYPEHWWVRSVGSPRLRTDGKRAMEAGVADSALRPIRGGEGATTGACATICAGS